MLLAAALEYGVGVIAGHDSDFERIEGLHVYKPIDVQ
jgi:predicted nucleic acid-binding protein